MLQTISIIITGKVQGVFFRQSTRDVAQQFGITGQIKNLSNGNVEIIATGTKEQLDKFIACCKQGPPKAIVIDASVEELALQEFTHFTILRS